MSQYFVMQIWKKIQVPRLIFVSVDDFSKVRGGRGEIKRMLTRILISLKRTVQISDI